MSTTRPLAREMTGTSREISGLTVPVTFNSAGASTWSALIRGNRSGLLTVTKLISPVSTVCGDCGAPSAGLNFFSHAVSERQTMRQRELFKKDLFIIGSPHALR